ncbi:MAG: hypothetical protein JWQ85_4090 [Mucilaginibacter sp.]|nr:hypothetical protein [Mucilaginibacter sp.]
MEELFGEPGDIVSPILIIIIQQRLSKLGSLCCINACVMNKAFYI